MLDIVVNEMGKVIKSAHTQNRLWTKRLHAQRLRNRTSQLHNENVPVTKSLSKKRLRNKKSSGRYLTLIFGPNLNIRKSTAVTFIY
jgi:hypothetical protein